MMTIVFDAYIYGRRDNTYNFSKPYTSYATGFVMYMTTTVPYGTRLDSRIHKHSVFRWLSRVFFSIGYPYYLIKKVNSYIVIHDGRFYKFDYEDLTLTYFL